MMYPKQIAYRNSRWLEAVRDLGYCVRCRTFGRCEAAHRDEGKGMGLKTSDAATAALCRTCHAELTDGKDLYRVEKRAEMDRCIVLTVIEMAAQGRVKIV